MTGFGDRLMQDFNARRARSTGLQKKAIYASAGGHDSALLLENKALGHPDYEDLEVGQSATAPMVAAFIDLKRFTARTFWDDPTVTADLAHTVLGGFTEIVEEFGGYPLGLRGDGLFAGWTPGDNQITAVAALMGCAQALHLIDTELNPRLRREGYQAVHVRAGLDYGDIVFTRTGTPRGSEVNPIGFAANFAAKCEKYATSEGIVAGETLRNLLPNNHLFTEHKYSPKEYQRDYDVKKYKFYDFNWKPFRDDLRGIAANIGRRPAATLGGVTR